LRFEYSKRDTDAGPIRCKNMDKRGDISPGRTPDTEHVLGDGTNKTADGRTVQRQVEQLNNDLFHRMADKAKTAVPAKK